MFTICAIFCSVIMVAQDDGELPEPPEPPVPAAPIPYMGVFALLAVGYGVFVLKNKEVK